MALVARVAVRSRRRLSPSFVRLELAGPQLADFGVDGPTYDVRIKLILPAADGRLPALGADTWWTDFQALPDAERGHVRTYTVRAVRGSGADTALVVDFVLHPGAHGPGSDWAGAAAVGDELIAVVPRRGTDWGGIEWRPPATDRLLLVGDETAVPAVCSILESLPRDACGAAYLEVPDRADVQDVAAPAGVRVRWLPRGGAPVGSLAVAAVAGGPPASLLAEAEAAERAAGDLMWETPTFPGVGESIGDPPTGPDTDAGTSADVYAWVAGESGMVRALRRHLVAERGLRRDQVAFMGYWREGVAMRA